jgi:cell division protein FtsZ
MSAPVKQQNRLRHLRGTVSRRAATQAPLSRDPFPNLPLSLPSSPTEPLGEPAIRRAGARMPDLRASEPKPLRTIDRERAALGAAERRAAREPQTKDSTLATSLPAVSNIPSTIQRVRPARFALIGIGGAGLNALSRLEDAGLSRLRMLGIDTSAQALERLGDTSRILLDGGTRGLGCGGNGAKAKEASLAARRQLETALSGVDVAFIVAGMAGGTGAGVSSVVARALKRSGAVTVGFGIMPFRFESKGRHERAERALGKLRRNCDTTVTLDNDRLLACAGETASLDVALRVGDEVIRQACTSLVDLTGRPGWINLDLPLVRDLLLGGGDGCVACGIGRGARPAQRALRAALASPLSNMDALSHARSVMVQISGGDDLELQDTAEAISLLEKRLPKDCMVHAGAALDPTLKGAAQVLVFGVGLAGPARLSLPWRQLRSSLSVLPGRLKLDLERGAYGFDAPPMRSAASRKAV